MESLPNDLYMPQTQDRMNNRPRILILTANKTEDLEFFYPFYRLNEAGYHVDIATPHGGAFQGKQGLGLKSSRKISDVIPGDYQLLYIPGGKAPAELKNNRDAINLVKLFVKNGKPIAAICHGPQLLAAADVIRGHRIAAWPEVEKEVRDAGAEYVNEMAVCDGLFITARWPADLPAHLKKTLEVLAISEQNQSPQIKGAA